ncbi:MAG TPA: hypothetical protein VGJ60_16495 [Chloroflexota bacterium]|jgi:hypothetical protein
MQNTDWILVTDLAAELGIPPSHPERWSIWTTAGFRPTRITVTNRTGVMHRWAVSTEQAERLRELRASALTLS